jgi:hypothetical protein
MLPLVKAAATLHRDQQKVSRHIIDTHVEPTLLDLWHAISIGGADKVAGRNHTW